MRRHGTFLSLLNSQRRVFAGVLGDAGATLKRLATLGRQDLVKGTSGVLGEATLAKLGRPYGRGPGPAANYTKAGNVGMRGVSKAKRQRFNLRGQVPRLPINRQSGKLQSSIAGPRKAAALAYDVAIGRGTDYARHVLHPAGTRLMVGRGLMGWRRVSGSYPPGMLERLHRARVRVLRDAIRSRYRQP